MAAFMQEAPTPYEPSLWDTLSFAARKGFESVVQTGDEVTQHALRTIGQTQTAQDLFKMGAELGEGTKGFVKEVATGGADVVKSVAIIFAIVGAFFLLALILI